jgi:hypothetical protein
MRLARSKEAAKMRTTVCAIALSPPNPPLSKKARLHRPKSRTQLDSEVATALRYMKDQLDGMSD